MDFQRINHAPPPHEFVLKVNPNVLKTIHSPNWWVESRILKWLRTRIDDLMEGLYLRTESEREIRQRAKWMRPEFVESVKVSEHGQHRQMQVIQLADNVDL